MNIKDPVLEILGICVLIAASDHRGTKRWVVSVVFYASLYRRKLLALQLH